ncbi:MAG: aminopeptidase P family protein [Chloroflexi bacterium]|nr:aminopeptidase P family protein [Chloroflexota bacterium]
MTLSRIQRLEELAAQNNLQAIAIVPGANMMYFSGLSFHLSERPTIAIFAKGQTPSIILPALEAAKPDKAPFKMQNFVYTDEKGPAQAFAEACAALKLQKATLGVEGRRMRVLETQWFEKFAPEIKFSMAESIIAQLRMKKDADEIKMMKQAIDIAQKALTATLPMIKVGVSERDIAAELMVQSLKHGSGELPFQPSVASGENGSLPHAGVTDRKVKNGDLITIDWGASVNGYFSDLTRTFALGEVDSELRKIYDLVKEANAKGREAARPKGTGQEVDRAARKVISDGGYGPFFTHRTGHGLGLDVHEEPDMKETETMPLEPGMTFTVEPGIYLPNKGGVRIEDNLVITENGAETMTSLGREFKVLG